MKTKTLLLVLALIFNSTLIIHNSEAQWVNVPNGLSTTIDPFWSLASIGNNLFAANRFGVYKSTNDGLNWALTNLQQTGNVLLVDGLNIYAGASYGVHLTTNNGLNWSSLGTDTVPRSIWTLAKYGDTIFAGCSNALGVFRSTNKGLNWKRTLIGVDISSIVIKGNYIFAGNWEQPSVFYSTNNGSNWGITSLGGSYPRVVLSLFVKGNLIFAGTDNDGVFVSSNNGLNWTQTSLNNASINCFHVIDNNIFAGELFYQKGVYLSTNDGVSWIHKNQGMVNEEVWSLTSNSQYIFAGTEKSIWRRSITEIVGVQNISTEIPAKYSLSQNFPNPFNPTTKIRFDVARVGDVKIVVYDIMGREVRTLLNEQLKPGTYEATFDGNGLNSGVYFYELMTDGFTETKRMILLK